MPRRIADTERRRRVQGRMGFMRWIDHWLGLPICFLLGLALTAIRRILPRRRRVISGKGTLAVFKFFGLGSILEATPLLRAIRKRYPEARLAFVTFDGNEALLRRLDLCTDLRIIRTKSFFAFVFDVLKQIWWLRTHRTEAAVDLEFFSKFSTLMSFFSGARVRVGFHLNDFWRYSLVTHPVYFNYYRHIADVYEQAGRRLGVEVSDHRISRIEVGEQARRTVEESLRRHGWTPGAPLLGMNVNAGELSYERRWPLERFASLVQMLLDRHGDLYVVLPGSPSERQYVLPLLDRLDESVRHRAIVVAGQWSLEEFIASLSLMDGLVTNDSGPLHMGAAQGTRMVSLWGPSQPTFYSPRAPGNRVIHEDYPCSPCVCMFTTFEGMWCDHEGWCMQAIRPQTVLEAVEAMLAEAKNTARAAAEPVA